MSNIDKINKFDRFYINVANEVAKLSYAKRSQVGAILVKDGNIISFGYNGMPHGFDNICEDENNVTNKEVLHAESNVIAKIAKTNQSSDNSILYITLSPCIECAKLIKQAGIKEVIYSNEYRETSGLEFLKKCDIKLKKVNCTN